MFIPFARSSGGGSTGSGGHWNTAVIRVIGQTEGAETSSALSVVRQWNLLERDAKHLLDQVNKGAVIVAVAGHGNIDDQIESVFQRHKAKQIDETNTAVPLAGSAASQATTAVANAPMASDNDVIEVIKEDLAVGKRRVQTDGVRIFSRIVETPVQESVALEEEHVRVDRQAINQPVNPADASLFQEKSVEVTETAEEPVVAKNARVVEEVVVGKETTQHTERVHDTVRHTEVDVEELEPDAANPNVKSGNARTASA